uniref:Ig-like domain-containing protein n=1 Tax=Oryzias melastigma TaxID=30732 RepID=A0A3B3CRA9_ORYME
YKNLPGAILTPPLSILLLADVCLGVEITQTPSEVLKKPGDEVQLVCSHGKTDYTYMQWYQKPPGDPLIVFTSTAQKDFGAFSKEKFSATKTEAERGTFTVKEVQPEDKGLYFCAVSQHSDTNQ